MVDTQTNGTSDVKVRMMIVIFETGPAQMPKIPGRYCHLAVEFLLNPGLTVLLVLVRLQYRSNRVLAICAASS